MRFGITLAGLLSRQLSGEQTCPDLRTRRTCRDMEVIALGLVKFDIHWLVTGC
jgi:hypothetical protein